MKSLKPLAIRLDLLKLGCVLIRLFFFIIVVMNAQWQNENKLIAEKIFTVPLLRLKMVWR